jgi:uncharacterized membrane protein
MNGAHWHLVLNHLPIIIPIISLLMMIAGLLMKSEILKRAAYSLFLLGAVATIAASLTGEGAEEVIEGIQGIDERFIKTHEESAEIFAILLYFLGGISIVGLWANWKGKSISHLLTIVAIALSLVVLFYARQTATTGGEIRHTEIRIDGPNNNNTVNQSQRQDEDDDDER